MDTGQPPSSTISSIPASTPPGIFGTKIPSLVTYVIGILLFFMPFIDIKCNNMSIQQVSGVELATGFKMKNKSSGNSFLSDLKSDNVTKSEKKDPNLFAMVALGLGVLGLLLSITNAKAAIGGAIITGIASAGSLIGMMLDIKKQMKIDRYGSGGGKSGDDDSFGLEKIGNQMSNIPGITVDFTPWFYVTVVAFLAAAFFCYKRMQSLKT